MASIGFRWLDILEKEFDKAFVDLDLAVGELDSEEPDVVFSVRQKLCTLSSCFAQLTHKAQTIFQNSAKIEAELIHMRAELIESKSKKDVLESELHNLLLQLHSSQLSKLPDSLGSKRQDQHLKPDVSAIKKKLEAEIRQSPIRIVKKESEELKFSPAAIEPAQYKAETSQLRSENASLRNEVLALTSEVYGAKLAAKYLDKELAGRIQQLQLLGREMRGDIRDKLWRQLESEILLQRHKTVVRACRRNSSLNSSEKCPKPEPETVTDGTEHFGDIRTVIVKRKPDQGLGISITGGREHGVPILISELEPNGPAALSEQLYIGDAILFVNEIDLRNACHREAVGILQQQTGDCTLQVQYIAADDSDNSLEEDGFHFRFFDEDVCDTNNLNNPRGTEEMINTPTAPRTPDSTPASRLSRSTSNSPEKKKSPTFLGKEETHIINSDNYNYNLNTNNGNEEEYKHTTDEKLSNIINRNSNNNKSPDTTTKIITNDIYNIDTTDLVLIDNSTNNIIKLENFKKVDIFSNINDNFNTSTNSLNSENLSSPMQTSTDVYLDSEILSTDLASNDSQSPKNLQTDTNPQKTNFDYETNILEIEKVDELFDEPKLYASNDSLSNPKSDQSLLNSVESCGSSPLHKPNREYKKQRKHKKKYFGVKTLQSIFNKHDGYSDISTTASELGDEPPLLVDTHDVKPRDVENKTEPTDKATLVKCNSVYAPETSTQFEENIHNLLSDIFIKNFTNVADQPASNVSISKPTGTKKYFSLHGQNLRVGKALRLCPNEDYTEVLENEQRKEKLLARYVYNANSLNADGVGDPDFGTPV
ncbi:uncharacterized protein LOC108908458 [Anoplophora glabripennis]|uniref:uncharacterized protein LOC108908458 n=1 Tax=Anoplophora glabripennis TaxID=217634 RepID=UPI000C79413B|nr:uncharacterized protein LOC108908458 [Anoplophora glabripennis]